MGWDSKKYFKNYEVLVKQDTKRIYIYLITR